MPIPELLELTRDLAEGVLLTDPQSLEQLALLHEQLTHAAQLLESDHPTLASAARAAVAGIEAIILREPGDAAAALDTVAAAVAAIQAVIVDGRACDEIPFLRDNKQGSSTGTPAAVPATPCSGQPVSAPSAHEMAATSSAEPPAIITQAMMLTSDAELTAEFVTESGEHLDAADVSLLTLEANPGDVEAINALFRAFHTIKGVTGFLDIKPIQVLAHECETLLDKCRKGETVLAGAALDVIFDAADVMKQLVATVAQALAGDRLLQPHPALPVLLPRIRAVTEGRVPVSTASSASGGASVPVTTPAASLGPLSSPVEVVASVEATSPHSELHPAPLAEGKTASGQTVVKETVRVDAQRLDKLVDIIGEMVIAEAMVSQSSDLIGRGSSPQARLMNHLDKITRELQELAMSLRMVPVRSAFQRMARLARDVSKKLNKPIDFVTAGDETELDKNVVDAIGDPLVHMVRNAVDHGIEDDVDARRRVGKPDSGRIELRAFHKGGSIYVEIEDDGKGLDPDRILAKARERGMIKEDETLPESEAFNLIFEPGFSTAKQITDVSGRGVGLDVVKRNIQALRGKIEIRSVKGQGTVFTIRLPLTLAIIEGMVFRLAEHRYIVPTLSIVRMIRPGEADLTTVFERGEMLKLGDRLVPLHRLERMFQVDRAIKSPFDAAVIVVEHDNRQVAFLVDELLGQQQIVIKPLGVMLRQYPGFTGGAIMPDGRVGLILDVAGLIALAGVTDTTRRAA